MRAIVGIRTQGWVANSLIDERISGFADGEIFYVVSNGRRTMPGYRWQIPEKDRWAIVAYTRALQRAAAGKVMPMPRTSSSRRSARINAGPLTMTGPERN